MTQELAWWYSNLTINLSFISVNPFYALTAAHCVAGRGIMSTSLIVGEHDRSTTSDTSFTAKYAISAFIPHGGFTASTNANDIALVRTNTEMIFNIGVHAVCLPFRMQTASFVGSIVTATGWGNTEFWAGQSQILQKVNLNVISNTGSCTSTYPQAASNGFLCTYTSGKDTCQVSGFSFEDCDRLTIFVFLYFSTTPERIFT